MGSSSLWPKSEIWERCILFFETSEEKPKQRYVEYWLRNYGSQGILHKAKGTNCSKPYDNLYYEEYKR
jgi:muramoyltetrapeptide carboxypeptidase LdcA involved in peptidoglycan recycling